MQQEENVQLNDTQRAYRTIGQALWNTLCRARSTQKEAPDCLNRLMDALAESEEKGSVCVQWSKTQKAVLSSKECEELKEFGLLVDKPEKLDQVGNQEIPFVLDCQPSVTRIYTQRRFMQEREVALSILAMSQKKSSALKAPVKKALLGFNELQYGPARENDEESRAEQQGAVAEALKHQFFIITGGPGTGKTTVVAKLLECLLIEIRRSKSRLPRRQVKPLPALCSRLLIPRSDSRTISATSSNESTPIPCLRAPFINGF